jgi:hypothetical protein
MKLAYEHFVKSFNQEIQQGRAPVAHACNPRYLEIRRVTVQSQASSSLDPISKTPSQNRAGGVAQRVGPEFSCTHTHTHTHTHEIQQSHLEGNVFQETLTERINK